MWTRVSNPTETLRNSSATSSPFSVFLKTYSRTSIIAVLVPLPFQNPCTPWCTKPCCSWYWSSYLASMAPIILDRAERKATGRYNLGACLSQPYPLKSGLTLAISHVLGYFFTSNLKFIISASSLDVHLLIFLMKP